MLARQSGAEPADRPRLTARQAECLYWVQAGKSSPEIGLILGLSSRTVDAYVAAACQRLGVRTRTEVVIRARSLGLIAAL